MVHCNPESVLKPKATRMSEHPSTLRDDATGLLNKVAQVTIFFWIMKVLATTLGEISGDFLSMTLKLGYWISLGITFAVLIAVLVAQIRAERFHPVIYWAAIIATTTTGTEVSDLMDRTLGLGYTIGALILFAGLAATLFVWWKREGDIYVYPIYRRPVELYYWIAIVFSNSLGTAFGDFLTDVVGLSYIWGAVVTAGVIFLVLALHYMEAFNAVLLFWIAFIFTRPFGATFGDFLTKPVANGALALPRGYAALITLALLVAVLAFSVWYEKRQEKETAD